MSTILDSLLFAVIFRMIWLVIIYYTFTRLFAKAAKDYKKEGIKGIWQEALLGLILVIIFIIFLLLQPSKYIIPGMNIFIGLYNFFANSWNSTLRDIVGLPITLPIFSLIG